MQITVKLFGEFREAAGKDRVELEVSSGATCGQALRELARREPEVGALFFTGEGHLRDHLHVFINGRNVASLNGLETPLSEGDVVSFLPPIGGG